MNDKTGNPGVQYSRIIWRPNDCPFIQLHFVFETELKIWPFCIGMVGHITRAIGNMYINFELCNPVAAPGRQGSQVISRSLRSWGRSSCANASAVKEPGHFEVRKSSVSHVIGCTFFLEKVDVLYVIVRPFVACLSSVCLKRSCTILRRLKFLPMFLRHLVPFVDIHQVKFYGYHPRRILLSG